MFQVVKYWNMAFTREEKADCMLELFRTSVLLWDYIKDGFYVPHLPHDLAQV